MATTQPRQILTITRNKTQQPPAKQEDRVALIEVWCTTGICEGEGTLVRDPSLLQGVRPREAKTERDIGQFFQWKRMSWFSRAPARKGWCALVVMSYIRESAWVESWDVSQRPAIVLAIDDWKLSLVQKSVPTFRYRWLRNSLLVILFGLFGIY
jgi:hypothetical protein